MITTPAFTHWTSSSPCDPEPETCYKCREETNLVDGDGYPMCADCQNQITREFMEDWARPALEELAGLACAILSSVNHQEAPDADRWEGWAEKLRSLAPGIADGLDEFAGKLVSE